ncbi:MAG TPA: tetratricopeptide repeat protein [Gemmatimonadaceae bacterium]|nr:tetratricopeptide repeat protein [Gemmatimonadaceae bacterium]
MSNVEKLKKKAAEFEQKKQFDRALEVYLQIIGQTEGQEDGDVTVYNRVGDLYLRLNKTDQAVNYYEQAVDLYTEGGYLNNAIALCNKILRHAPSRHQIYYKLGKISAKKGFNSDAKKNFLEYADRMHRAGRDTDAFKALQEFADLCPGQDDIRLMLADQLARAGKTAEAIEQLQILHESLDAEGRSSEAEATVQRIHTLDPKVEPRRSKEPRQKDAGGLVFLDLGGSPAKPRPKMPGIERTSLAPEVPSRPRTPTHVQPLPEFEQLPDDLEAMDPIAPVEGLELQHEAESTEQIEPAFDLSLSDVDISPLEGLESTADPIQFAIDPEASPMTPTDPLQGLVGVGGAGTGEPGLGEPLLDEDPLAGLNILEDDRFFTNDDGPLSKPAPAKSASHAPVHDMPDIEPLELHVEEPEPAAAHQPEPEEETEPEPEAEPEEEPAPPPRKVAHKTPPKRVEQHVEEEGEEVEEEEEEEKPAPRAEPPKPSKPKLVEPLRMTRPKLKPKAKEPEPEAEPEPAAPAERRPINPFQRTAKGKNASPKSAPRIATPPTEVPRAATPKENTPHRGDDNFVDLADWLREESGPRSYRMVAEEDANREEGEEADFTDMLEKFKAGVAANVDDEDFDSHYDLGVAYREMGLIDEAIFEFQKALRGATQRIRAYEALGQCFIDRAEHDVAITVLGRALREPGMEDEDLIGVLYLLGFASEGSRKPRDAAAYYQRVFAIDIDFRDVSKRLKQMAKAASK